MLLCEYGLDFPLKKMLDLIRRIFTRLGWARPHKIFSIFQYILFRVQLAIDFRHNYSYRHVSGDARETHLLLCR